MGSTWKLQDAKNRFSEVVDHAVHEGPQTITRRGKQTAVILSIGAFRSMSGAKGDFVRFLRESPLADSGIELERTPDYGRRIDL